MPTTTIPTTAPCIDDNSNVCAQGVQNSLSFCYEAEDICCATCRARRVEGLPENCAWGDKVYPRHINLSELKVSHFSVNQVNLLIIL